MKIEQIAIGIIASIILLAIFATIVGKSAKTADLIQTAFSTLVQFVRVTVSPITNKVVDTKNPMN